MKHLWRRPAFIIIALAVILFPVLTGCTPAPVPTPVPPPPAAPPPPASGAAAADYGDAPDGGPTGYPAPFIQTGQFKTTRANNGARTLSISDATLGANASLEADANDPADPDGSPNLTNSDSDDAQVKLDITLVSIPPPAKLRVQVAGHNGGAFYINAVIDMNLDGKWGGAASGGNPEWAVKNFAVSVPANSPPTWTDIPTTFGFGDGNILPDGAYMRIALTKESITSNDWDGSGQFSSGEIEDVVIRLPSQGSPPKKMPILVIEPQKPDNYSIPVFSSDPPTYQYDFKGAAVRTVVVRVRNIRLDAGGSFTWAVQNIDGGVTLAPPGGGPLTVDKAVIGLAPGGRTDYQDITLTATKGLPLPSRWLFTVQAIDPESVMSNGDVIVGFAVTPPVELSFNDDTKAWIPGNFVLDISVLRDPAGHLEFVALPRTLVAKVDVVGDPTVTISGPGAWVTVTGEIKPDGSFEAAGKGTVAGRPNISVTFKGIWKEYTGFSGEYTMGAGGELPGAQPITYKVEAKRQ